MLQVFITAFLVACGQIAWKAAAKSVPDTAQGIVKSMIAIMQSPYFWLGAVAYVIGVVFWLSQLQRSALSSAFAMTTGCVFTMALLADLFLFGATISLMRGISLALILVGIWLGTQA